MPGPGRRTARPSPTPPGPDAPEGTLDQSRIEDRVAPYPIYPGSGNAALDAIGALTPASDRGVYFTSGTAASLFTFTSYGRSIAAVASEAALKALVNLEIGTDVQAQNARLTDISGLAVTDGNFIVGDGMNWVAESGSTARTSLGLGGLATKSSVNNGDWSGTDLAVTNGGTGASTAADARTNLGLAAVAASGDYANMSGIPISPSYTVSGVPDASSFTGGTIFVTDETGGAVLAFSDGSDWRRCTDRAVVS